MAEEKTKTKQEEKKPDILKSAKKAEAAPAQAAKPDVKVLAKETASQCGQLIKEKWDGAGNDLCYKVISVVIFAVALLYAIMAIAALFRDFDPFGQFCTRLYGVAILLAVQRIMTYAKVIAKK